MPTTTSRRPTGPRPKARRWPRLRPGDERGQSLVEFSLILTPLFLILLGIIQFGLIFNTYITVTNAAREGARIGTIYQYQRAVTEGTNDTARNESMRTTLLQGFNGLAKTSPNFTNSSSWVSGGTTDARTYTTGDIEVTYTRPDGTTANEPRVGYYVTVRATYHQDIVIPLIGIFLPLDGNGRLPLVGEVTMVVN
jgi:Flp pilus assembly protein TadG